MFYQHLVDVLGGTGNIILGFLLLPQLRHQHLHLRVATHTGSLHANPSQSVPAAAAIPDELDAGMMQRGQLLALIVVRILAIIVNGDGLALIIDGVHFPLLLHGAAQFPVL